jgi:putative sigma-54 modulation protein
MDRHLELPNRMSFVCTQRKANMKITWTGRHLDLAPAQANKLTAEFEKVGRILDNGKGEAAAHVVLSHERHLSNVEIRVSYHDHELLGEGSDSDLFTAIHSAVGKLEKQAVRVREKWRQSKRVPRKEAVADEAREENTIIGSEANSPANEAGKSPAH